VANKPARKKLAKKGPKKRKPVIATRRSTAGKGFEFEDYVAAWLVLEALAGRDLPIRGDPQRLQMQTGPILWDIDDILFSTQGLAGEVRLAVSCKGNVQVTANGLPKSFTSQAWKLWTKADSPLNRAGDVMALATQGTHADFQAAWSEIKAAASGAEPALAAAQIRATPRYKRIFEAIKAAAVVPVDDADVLALIRRVEVLPLDFKLAQSKDERSAVAVARSLLTDATREDAKKLWSEMVSRAQGTRLGSGTLEVSDLLQYLRPRFSLKDLPDYAPSWSRLRALSAETENLVQTTLPSGARLAFEASIDELAMRLGAHSCVPIYGESGTGKSALVKTFLKARFPKAAVLWLAPEHLEQALNEAYRASFGLAHPLLRVLTTTVAPENFLIIDAAERLTPAARAKAEHLVSQLLASNGTATPPLWRIILVGQTELWASGDLQGIARMPLVPPQEIGLRSTEEVASILFATPELAWLALHQDALEALTNLRTLGWVIQASGVFQSSAQAPNSLVAVADKLWSHWTAGRTVLEGFLMRLAVRDAAFEHSVRISTLDSADARAFDDRPPQCPVRRNTANNHVQFEHDLAADWARFQKLKEIAADTAQWAAYAGNPLWTAALRMLGQLLLRQPSGDRVAWDVAFDAVQAAQGRLQLADDILLDALFLDPAASIFLEQRAEMLFANHARHLQRLLTRFEHVATVSGVDPRPEGPLKDFAIYLEATFRTPIIGRWPAMAVFLNRHQQRLTDLVLTRVSRLCERWLTAMPLRQTDGTPFPYRREFAELALATARARQLDAAKGTMYVGEDHIIFQAAFAGAQDIPDDVAAWALEMAWRRPLRADLAEKLKSHREEDAAEHRRRLEGDADYRERHERKQHMPYLPSGRRLPPWPMGPRGRVDNRFTETVLRNTTFQRLMHARPAAASEVLLAVQIEAKPEERYSSSRNYHEELGLAYDREGYPTAYWKSPFFSFLHIDPSTALDALLKLVSFCVARWEHAIARETGNAPSPLTLHLADGTVRLARGRYNAFAWSQTSYHANGQLYSALAALEKWLCSLVDRDVDVAPHIDRLMRDADNVAVLGVLINVGKRLPDLFRAALKPLLAVGPFYLWDEARVRNGEYGFDAVTWARSGELIFEMARDWYAAPYRKKNLIAIVSELCREDHVLGDFVNTAAQHWTIPEGDKERIEARIRIAQLDYRNYPPEGAEAAFVWPKDLATDIASFERSKRRARELLDFPENCRRFLLNPGLLPDEQVAQIASLMGAADGDEAIDLEEEVVRPARVASAAVLLLGAKDWLAANSAVRDRARAIIDVAIAETDLDHDRTKFRYSMAPSYLEFAAYFVFHEWYSAPSAVTDQALMRIATSADERAAAIIFTMSYVHRLPLGDRWWRLLHLSLLWSGLSILKPRVGRKDEAGERRWRRWARWLISRPLSGVRCGVDDIKPLDLAKRVEIFEAHLWEAEYRQDGRRFRRDPSRRMSGALDTHFLEVAFAWLVTSANQLPAENVEREYRRDLLKKFWAHEAWRLVGSESESDDYSHMCQFGYKLLQAIAAICLETDVNTAPSLWQPVFDLGPKGHYGIGHFFLCFFSHLAETSDTAAFAAHWRPMIEAILAGRGWMDGPWYYQQSLERQALGFGHEDALVRPAQSTPLVEAVEDLYRSWAARRLPAAEDNLAGFCSFLATRAGKPLRLKGLIWIADALRSRSDERSWYRDQTSAAFVDLLGTIITEDGAAAVAGTDTKQALMDLVGLAVSRQLSAALALQDRLKTLL
jgi:hypothetical protein